MRNLVALALLLTSSLLWGAVYRWTDADGKIHFGDQPAENAELIKLKKSPPVAKAAASTAAERKQQQQRLLNLYQEEREEKKKQRIEKKAERKKRKKACIQAKREWVKYRDSKAIYDFSDSGERAYYSEEKRERYIKHLKGQVTKWCR
jgi:hypothetical protein